MTGTADLRCVLVGGGGHASVLIDTIQASGVARIYGILEAEQSRWKTELLGIPILGGDDLLPEVIRAGVNCFVIGVGSVGNNQPRRKLYEWAASTGLAALIITHPSAVCSRYAKLGPGSVLLPGAAVNAGAVIGANVIVNTRAVVEHDCHVGDHAHIASGAVLSGTVTIGEGAFVGAGATVRQRITIGEGAIVGAGAVVVRDVAPHTKVAGNPARPIQ